MRPYEGSPGWRHRAAAQDNRRKQPGLPSMPEDQSPSQVRGLERGYLAPTPGVENTPTQASHGPGAGCSPQSKQPITNAWGLGHDFWFKPWTAGTSSIRPTTCGHGTTARQQCRHPRSKPSGHWVLVFFAFATFNFKKSLGIPGYILPGHGPRQGAILPAIVMQPLTKPRIRLFRKNGGNALGISENDGPLIIMNVAIMWSDPADDKRITCGRRPPHQLQCNVCLFNKPWYGISISSRPRPA
ncbi:MAG: hypothetical protein Q9182_003006 [Xanthomendoza sp. 2 TL-2023]